MKFFLDHWLPVRHARALDAMFQPEHSFAHVRDEFQPGILDEQYVAALRQERDGALISGDHRIGTSAHRCRAWQASGLTVFFLNRDWTRLPAIEQHAKLSAALEAIIEQAKVAKAGSGFAVSPAGKIEQLYRPNSGRSPE